MTAFLVIVGLLMVWRATISFRSGCRPSWARLLAGRPLRRRPRRHRRLGDRKRRREAAVAARALLAMLASGGQDPVAHLVVGVVLQPGEVPLIHARARLATWDTQAAQVTRARVRRWGRRFESMARQVAVGGWQDRGDVAFLITSLRLVGRIQPDGELLSIWWNGLDGIQVDLDVDTLQLDGVNGWRGQITGPGVAPVGVAAVAACHGPGALLSHPALACLRGPSTQAETVRAPEPPALGPGDAMPGAWSYGRLK